MFLEAEKSYYPQGQKSGFSKDPLGYATQDLILPPRNQTVATNALQVFRTSSVYPLVSTNPSNI